jgi:hypothetical protein
MKPIVTYLALLGLLLAVTAWHLSHGQQLVGFTVLGTGTLALLAFQGATTFSVPFWAEKTDLPMPSTWHVFSTTVMIEAATIGMATISPVGACVIRGAGFIIQLGTIGKLNRDFQGEAQLEEITKKQIHEKH